MLYNFSDSIWATLAKIIEKNTANDVSYAWKSFITLATGLADVAFFAFHFFINK